MKLSQAIIDRDKIDTEGKADFIAWDDELPGFGVRIREGGSRTFIVQYKTDTQNRRMTIGSVKNLSLMAARKQAKKELGKVALGQDPQAVKSEARQFGTFKAVAEDFIEFQTPRLRPASLYATRHYLMDYCKPLHAMKASDIKRTDIAAVLRGISKHGSVTADRARAALSKCFAWAIADGLCGETFVNPVIGTNKYADDAQPRDRVLTNAELAAIWNAVDDDDYGRIVKLLILTGARRNEIAMLEWEEVRGDLLSLPGERTKNGLHLDIPLAAMAREIIGERPDDPPRFVFGKRSGSGFSGFSKAKTLLDAKLKFTKPWRLHDIRRTVATEMNEHDIAEPHIIEACLNHISGAAKAGVAGVYNHAKYNPQKRKALDEWATLVSVILARASGANVERPQFGKGA